MSSVEYVIKCPKCSSRATAQMHEVGTRGTYRELLVKYGARRIVCQSCGYNHEVPPEECDDYELWYATKFKGKRLWANNQRHLAFLIAWLSDEIQKNSLCLGDRAVVEAFPKWMILAKNRPEILKQLKKMTTEIPKRHRDRRSPKRR
jgi:hypothetical protein